MQQTNVYSISGNNDSDPIEFRIEIIGENNSKTTHHVILTKKYYQRIAGGLISPEELVRSSFEFLLEREPKESILPRFNLTEIEKYFPEYEKTISSQFKK